MTFYITVHWYQFMNLSGIPEELVREKSRNPEREIERER